MNRKKTKAKANDSIYYLAYGSNLNIRQMKRRCPTAKLLGRTTLNNCRLRFRGHKDFAVATVEPHPDYYVPVLVWELKPSDEAALDAYEGYPHLYRKEYVKVVVNEHEYKVMLYVMNTDKTNGRIGCQHYSRPSFGYYQTIEDGYLAAGFDLSILKAALAASETKAAMTDTIRKQILAIRDTGKTNMFDIRMVQYLADQAGYHELVLYLEDHRKEYTKFIMTGEAE